MTIFFWWSGGGIFLPTGSAIVFDRDFGHLWQRKAVLYSSFFPLSLSLLSSLSSYVAGFFSPLSSVFVTPRELSLACGMVCYVICTPQDLSFSGGAVLGLVRCPWRSLGAGVDGRGFISAPGQITSTIFRWRLLVFFFFLLGYVALVPCHL